VKPINPGGLSTSRLMRRGTKFLGSAVPVNIPNLNEAENLVFVSKTVPASNEIVVVDNRRANLTPVRRARDE
jgi:hypothetical protein